MTFLNRRRSLRILSALAFSTVVFAIASPMATVDATQMSPVQSDLLFAEMRSTASFATPNFSDAPGEFRFITPIAPNPPDQNADFDADLLPNLTVKICKINGSACSYLKTFTSTTSPDRIRIENKQGRFFIVNWTTDASFDNTPVYRVSVEVPGETLGTVDIPPSAYRQWGRTWPIKFIVEKDPRLWSRLLEAGGMTIWQVADELRTKFGFCNNELRDLLAGAFPDVSDEQIAEVVGGVCQEVELFPTTKIADKATRDALGLYDISSGRMVFIGDTTLLKNLRVNDVLVGRESAAAPYGYMRKVRSISKSKNVYTLETVQAKFTEAIKVGTLQVSGGLEPADASSLSGNKLASANTKLVGGTIDIGQLIPFERHIDVVIDLNGGDDEIGGTGTIRVVGDVEIKAGYNIGAGIELCTTPPFACADRVEAWMGYIHRSNLRVTGTFDGHVRKEFAYPIPMSPIFFMVGPVPVWLVPEINVIVGFDGTAHVNFEFATEAQSTVKPYIKWTDDQGWQDLSTFAPLSNTFFDAKFDGNARMEGYAKLDAALLLYGAIGPSMDGSLGIVGEAQTGGSPFWKISGHVKAGIGLRSAFTDLFDLDVHEDFLDETFTIEEAENQPPKCTWVTDTISAEIGVQKVLGPRSGFEGYFECTDLEGDIPTYSAVSSNTSDGTNGVVPLVYAFQSGGLRTVTVTARDSDGGSFSFPLNVDVHNSLPIVNVFASTTAEATVQFFMSAEAFDPDTNAFLPCSRIDWDAGPDTVTELNGGCGAVVSFAQPGIRTVTVSATDYYGGVGTISISVTVLPAPANLPPVIDSASLEIHASSPPGGGFCFLNNNFCLVPATDSAQYLWPGFGQQRDDEWAVPLTMWVEASDPEGDPINYQWRCQDQAQTQVVIATPTGDGVYECTPPYVPGTVIEVFAIVSDGTFRPSNTTPKRTFFYRVTPN